MEDEDRLCQHRGLLESAQRFRPRLVEFEGGRDVSRRVGGLSTYLPTLIKVDVKTLCEARKCINNPELFAEYLRVTASEQLSQVCNGKGVRGAGEQT